MSNRFSNRYYLQIQQTVDGRATGQVLPRLAEFDDSPELTRGDLVTADYHATLNANAGTFEAWYYDVNLYEYYDTEPVDSEIHIL